MKLKIKFGTKQIILTCVAVVLIVVLALVNYFLDYYSLIIHRFLAGDSVDVTQGEVADALTIADESVREVAGESMVLLKNENYLPKKDLKKVNLFGYGSTDGGFLLTGGGSGGTTILDTDAKGNPRIKVDLTDAFKEAEIEYNAELIAAYESFSDVDADYRSGGSTNAYVAASMVNPGESFYTAELMSKAKAFSEVAVVTLSRWGAENVDMSAGGELKNTGSYKDGAYLALTAEEKAMLDKLRDNGFDVIVLLNVCNNMELGFLDEYANIKACLFVGIPGQSGAAAIPKILRGDINPSGKMSDILPYSYREYDPTYLNATKSGNDLVYQEGIYFGYKWYETADADGYFDEITRGDKTGYDAVVQYPFGHGLSYTSFEWSVADWNGLTGSFDPNKTYEIKVKVTNTGDEPGKEVVQLYGHAPYKAGGIEKAERVLLDFAKTPLLYPDSQKGEGKPNSAEVVLSFTGYDLASYDAYDKNSNGFKGYELENGEYVISVMYNSHDAFESKTATLSSGVRFENDPVTRKPVGNLFTADSAYANCPIDGSTAYASPIDYLSRANKFANYPKASAGTSKDSVVNAAVGYDYDGYNNADVKNYLYGEDVGLYLVQAKDGESSKRATAAQLSGDDTTVELEFNKDLVNELLDYDNDEIWNIFLDQMTRDEIKNLIGNGGFRTVEVYSIGKPRCTDKDGPAGFNNNVTEAGKASSYTLWPSESLIGCSFDKALAKKVGEVQGDIAKAMGVNGWYGPGVNLHRSVYNARNYEYYSEDPVLSGKLAAQTIIGAKNKNLYCYLKHFAVSEAGVNPKNVNTWLTEQTMRESYLRAFEIAVKLGKGNAMMSAFNRVGATLAGYNHALLTDVLRTEWGFNGSVITDWFEGRGYMDDFTEGVRAGNDLWLGGTTEKPADLDLNKPDVAYAARKAVKNIIYTYIVTNAEGGSVKVNAESKSGLFIALWAIIDILLIGGIACCAVFFFIDPRKKTRVAQSAFDINCGNGNDPPAPDGNDPTSDAASESAEADVTDNGKPD